MMKRFNWLRRIGPKCEATTKRAGLPCQNSPMANGRCRFHGGRTPKGDAWHKPAWPDAASPDANARLNRKLIDRERDAKKRKRRLAAMAPEERAQHEAWQRTHKPGSAAKRAAVRAERLQNSQARALLTRPYAPPVTPELEALRRQLAELEAERDRQQQSISDDEGIFG